MDDLTQTAQSLAPIYITSKTRNLLANTLKSIKEMYGFDVPQSSILETAMIDYNRKLERQLRRKGKQA